MALRVMSIWEYDLDMTKSATGWETPMNILYYDLTGENLARVIHTTMVIISKSE